MDPIRDATASCITHGRNLFYRLVFLIGMDPALAMQIIALWLLIEGNGEANLLRRIDSFHGDRFLVNAAIGEKLIRALHARPDKAPGSALRTTFHKQAITGVLFLLNNVCCKVLADLRQKADEQGITGREMQESSHPNSSRLLQQYKQDYWQIQINTNFHGGESSSSRSMPSAAIQLTQDTFQQSFSQSSTNNMGPYCLNWNSIAPQDDNRTLFVTFSNGLPLTQEEVYDFFMRHFGDVESVSVEVPIEDRPPQYARVTFGSRHTMLRVLNGEERVKFMSGRKHLWCRKFDHKKPFKAQKYADI
ncbi:hypothetical protein EJB05_03535, partial [Eragrostis curvula]